MVMSILLPVLFSVILSLLFLHEMDAVRNAEWKMFVILKDMDETKAYRIFTLLHLPLYAALLCMLFFCLSNRCVLCRGHIFDRAYRAAPDV